MLLSLRQNKLECIFVTPQDSSPPSVVRKRLFLWAWPPGGQAHRKHDASRLWRRGIRHLSSSLSYYSTCVSQLFSSPALFLYHSCHWLPEECKGKMPGGVPFGTPPAMRK